MIQKYEDVRVSKLGIQVFGESEMSRVNKLSTSGENSGDIWIADNRTAVVVFVQ